MKVTSVFIRHGYGCHNAANSLGSSVKFVDPQLTPSGIEATIKNGKGIIRALKEYGLSGIDVVGCSPLLRCMETALVMTRTWKNPPKKIFVLPFLREVAEHEPDKNSRRAREIISTHPSYMMKTLDEQKKYLQEQGILEYFDFTYLDDFLRSEPGDIKIFLRWFLGIWNMEDPTFARKSTINMLIVTHAGVMKSYFNRSFVNNAGGIVMGNVEIQNDIVSFDPLEIKHIQPIVTKYPRENSEFCESSRCKELCVIK